MTEVDTYKYLGLHIDNNLNFQSHHKKVTSRIQLKLNQFKKIRKFINNRASSLIYKCTLLPALEYADFIQDQGIVYINKTLQKIENQGLQIAYNQHILPYDQRDSSETLHRKSRLFRLIHQRKLHLLQFAFQLKNDITLLDTRNIPTRRRAGIVFKIRKSNHYKFPKDPYYCGMTAWNDLTVNTSLIEDKIAFTRAIKDSVQNPYVKVL